MRRAAFDGYVGVGRLVDTETGRYYGMVDYSVINNKETNLNDDYVLGFEVIGKPGHKIECYGDAQNTWMDNYGVEGFTDGSTDGSISDIAVADNVIAVGSYNTRNQWTCLDGGTAHYEGDAFKVGGISGFSSYGHAYVSVKSLAECGVAHHIGILHLVILGAAVVRTDVVSDHRHALRLPVAALLVVDHGNQGPHDKRTMLNTVLNMLGTKGIICISAGNEGDLKIALKKTFAEGDTRVKTMIYPYVM